MDILLVSSIDIFWFEVEPIPYLGPLVMRDILKDYYEVEYLDFRLIEELKDIKLTKNTNEIIEMFSEYVVNKKPKIVGFYTICHSFVFTVQVAQHIKKLDANIKIVFGGPHATLTAENCISFLDFLDVVCLGESELSIKPLMDALINDTDMSVVPGIVYKKSNEVIKNPHAELLKNEELSKYTVYDFSPLLRPETSKPILIEGGRGCPYSCTFCSTNLFWGKKFRVKPVDMLISEMNKFNEFYGFDSFAIMHDHFTSNKRHIMEFCQKLIENGRAYKWACSSRVDALDDEMLEQFKNSKCESIYLGIETGSIRMQRILNKNIKLDNVLETLKKIHDLGIDATVSFIYGSPDETEEDFIETIKMIEAIFLAGIYKIQLNSYMLLPNTEETNKVKNRLYFDKNAINFTLFNEDSFSEKCVELIQSCPDIFVQYYSFDSFVKTKYVYIDSMIVALSVLFSCFKNVFARLIGKYGLDKLYLKYENCFKNVRSLLDKISHPEYIGMKFFLVLYDVILPMLNNEELEIHELEFSQLYKYERLMVEHYITQKPFPVVHEFEIDIEELKKTGQCIKEKCYIRYINKENRVVTAKCSDENRLWRVVVPERNNPNDE